MPLMPATRPLSITNIAAAMPMMKPPSSAVIGVNASQSKLIAGLGTDLSRDHSAPGAARIALNFAKCVALQER